MPNVSSTTRWLSSTSLWKKSSLWSPTKPKRRARTQRCHANSQVTEAPVVLLSILPMIGTAFWSAWQLKGVSMPRCYWDRPLLSFDSISLGLGNRRLSFKPSNLFSDFLWVCVCALSEPISFLDLLEFRALILSDPFPRFYQAYLLLFMVTIWAPTVYAS